MLCSLTNTADIALMVCFDSGRTEFLEPGNKAYYDDSQEIATSETWDFVEWGWVKDNDEEFMDEQGLKLSSHDWAVEGF